MSLCCVVSVSVSTTSDDKVQWNCIWQTFNYWFRLLLLIMLTNYYFLFTRAYYNLPLLNNHRSVIPGNSHWTRWHRVFVPGAMIKCSCWLGAFLLGFRYTVVPFTLLVLVLAYLEGEIMEQRNTKCFLARDNMIICTRVAIAAAATLLLLRAFFSSWESMFSAWVQELQEGTLLLYQWVPRE